MMWIKSIRYVRWINTPYIREEIGNNTIEEFQVIDQELWYIYIFYSAETDQILKKWMEVKLNL